jgi:DNA-binding MarR family transcriptional regulator
MSDPSSTATLLFLREEELRQGMELLFSADRDLAGVVDPQLAELQFDRTHLRILQLVGRTPQITVSLLAAQLHLTKQSLGRALDPLVDQGLVLARVGPRDRRQRQLSLSEAGASLERRLSQRLMTRLARAYREAGSQAVEGFRRVLLGLLEDAEERQRFERRTPHGRS